MAELRLSRARPLGRAQVVSVLKRVLPAMALTLFGLVLFWDTSDNSASGITFSEADIETLQNGIQVTRPQFSGASLGGDLYDFNAETVIPRDRDLQMADVETMDGRISFRDGLIAEIQSERAEIDFTARHVVLDTGVGLQTSDGYTATAPYAEIDIAAGSLRADGPVIATGPPGNITAGGLVITPLEETPGLDFGNDVMMQFTNGVTLTYIPGAEDTR